MLTLTKRTKCLFVCLFLLITLTCVAKQHCPVLTLMMDAVFIHLLRRFLNLWLMSWTRSPAALGSPATPQVTASVVGLGVRSSLCHLLRSVTVRVCFTSRLKTIIIYIYWLAEGFLHGSLRSWTAGCLGIHYEQHSGCCVVFAALFATSCWLVAVFN